MTTHRSLHDRFRFGAPGSGASLEQGTSIPQDTKVGSGGVAGVEERRLTVFHFRWQDCERDCTKVLTLAEQGGNVKALYRRALARKERKLFDEARNGEGPLLPG